MMALKLCYVAPTGITLLTFLKTFPGRGGRQYIGASMQKQYLKEIYVEIHSYDCGFLNRNSLITELPSFNFFCYSGYLDIFSSWYVT